MSLHQLTALSSRLIPNAYLTQLLNGKVLKTMISVIAKAAMNTENDDFLQRLFKTVTNVSTFPIKPVIRITGVTYVHNLDENLISIRIVETSYSNNRIYACSNSKVLYPLRSVVF